MAISQPISTDPLNVPDHSLMHRIIASDPAAAVKSIGVNSDNTISILAGIAFPAVQVADAGANVLDDYEEGTWTVTVTCATSGTITLKAANDTGVYTKVGRLVTVGAQVAVDSVSSPLGYVTINLPFAIADQTETSERFVGSIEFGGVAYGGNYVVAKCVGGSVFQLDEITTNGAIGNVDGADFAANDTIAFTITYFTS